MGNDWQVLKRELEEYAEKKGVPIIRGPERELLLKAAALAEPRRMLEIGTATPPFFWQSVFQRPRSIRWSLMKSDITWRSR